MDKKTLIRRTAVLIAIGICAIAVYLVAPAPTSDFKDAYETYARVADQQDSAAYLPGSATNPVRRELNRALSAALTDTLTDTERLALAERGIGLLADAEAQIDAMGDLAPRVTEARTLVAESSSLLDTQRVRTARAIILEASRERARLIEDIRGYSYRANFYTEEILVRIVTDKGALTASHAQYLNDLIPEVEKQFDTRATLYQELEATKNTIEAAYRGFEGV
jgi:hypothetical protein